MSDNHDITVRQMLSPQIEERIGLLGRHAELQAVRMCGEIIELDGRDKTLKQEISLLKGELDRCAATISWRSGLLQRSLTMLRDEPCASSPGGAALIAEIKRELKAATSTTGSDHVHSQ